MAPECMRRTQLSEVRWQSIPHSWSGDTECSVSELQWRCLLKNQSIGGSSIVADAGLFAIQSWGLFKF